MVTGLLPESGHLRCSLRQLQSYTTPLQRSPVGRDCSCISRESIFCSLMNRQEQGRKVTAWKWHEVERKASRWVLIALAWWLHVHWADLKWGSLPRGVGTCFTWCLGIDPWRTPHPVWSLNFTNLFQVSNPSFTEVSLRRQMGSGMHPSHYCLLHC